mmetsp:Transcript_103626/g.273951  ORF Transcript_103626/g.273951 Transcript_103626/m.273951 type:complete len:83 (-) Transcript_103626:205-453(-)
MVHHLCIVLEGCRKPFAAIAYHLEHQVGLLWCARGSGEGTHERKGSERKRAGGEEEQEEEEEEEKVAAALSLRSVKKSKRIR